MATIVERYLSVEEFLEIDFGSDKKAELDRGVIRMMAGGTAAHSRVQRNLITFLAIALRGSGCQPFGSDVLVRTGIASLRYPDVSIYCNKDDRAYDRERVFDDPRAVFEILSPSTTFIDEGIKLGEYQSMPTVSSIVYVDPERERVRVLTRSWPEGWSDSWLQPEQAVELPEFELSIPQAEIFRRD